MAVLSEDYLKNVKSNLLTDRNGINYGQPTAIDVSTVEGQNEVEKVQPTIGDGLSLKEGQVMTFKGLIKVPVSINPPQGSRLRAQPNPKDRIYAILENADGKPMRARVQDLCPYLEGEQSDFENTDHRSEWQRIQNARAIAINGSGSNSEILAKMDKQGTITVSLVSKKIARNVTPFKLPNGEMQTTITQRYYLFK